MEIIRIDGIVDSYGYLTSEVRYQLNRNKGNEVTLVLSSLGGDVSEAMKIAELIQSHGKVTVRFIGCNASASTWMVYGAAKIEAAEDSMFLIHKCSNFVSVYKSMKTEDIENEIKRLESMKKSQEAFNLTIAQKYFNHCADKGTTFEDVLKLMEEERWITAKDALKFGLIDSITSGVNKMSKNQMETVMNVCSDLNLPVPQFAEEKSMVQQIIDGVKSLLSANHEPAGSPAEEPENTGTGEENNPQNVETSTQNVEKTTDTNQTKPTNIMYKLLFNLCVLLGIATANQTEEKQETVTLTADQLQKIEDALAEGKTVKDAMAEVLGVLDGISENVKNIEGAKNKALAVAALIKNFPGFAPSNQEPGKEKSDKKLKDLENVSKDPINEEMRQLYGK